MSDYLYVKAGHCFRKEYEALMQLSEIQKSNNGITTEGFRALNDILTEVKSKSIKELYCSFARSILKYEKRTLAENATKIFDLRGGFFEDLCWQSIHDVQCSQYLSDLCYNLCEFVTNETVHIKSLILTTATCLALSERFDEMQRKLQTFLRENLLGDSKISEASFRIGLGITRGFLTAYDQYERMLIPDGRFQTDALGFSRFNRFRQMLSNEEDWSRKREQPPESNGVSLRRLIGHIVDQLHSFARLSSWTCEHSHGTLTSQSIICYSSRDSKDRVIVAFVRSGSPLKDILRKFNFIDDLIEPSSTLVLSNVDEKKLEYNATWLGQVTYKEIELSIIENKKKKREKLCPHSTSCDIDITSAVTEHSTFNSFLLGSLKCSDSAFFREILQNKTNADKSILTELVTDSVYLLNLLPTSQDICYGLYNLFENAQRNDGNCLIKLLKISSISAAELIYVIEAIGTLLTSKKSKYLPGSKGFKDFVYLFVDSNGIRQLLEIKDLPLVVYKNEGKLVLNANVLCEENHCILTDFMKDLTSALTMAEIGDGHRLIRMMLKNSFSAVKSSRISQEIINSNKEGFLSLCFQNLKDIILPERGYYHLEASLRTDVTAFTRCIMIIDMIGTFFQSSDKKSVDDLLTDKEWQRLILALLFCPNQFLIRARIAALLLEIISSHQTIIVSMLSNHFDFVLNGKINRNYRNLCSLDQSIELLTCHLCLRKYESSQIDIIGDVEMVISKLCQHFMCLNKTNEEYDGDEAAFQNISYFLVHVLDLVIALIYLKKTDDGVSDKDTFINEFTFYLLKNMALPFADVHEAVLQSRDFKFTSLHLM
ncbi:hypothetical protein ACOME3_005992 [Neoechinorhynchus agilis]